MLITPEELALRKITIERAYPPGTFDDRGGAFRQTGALLVRAIAELANSDIRIRGHLATGVETDCDRCAGRMNLEIGQDFDLSYRPVTAIASSEEAEIDGGELDVGFYRGEGVEFEELLREQIILALPMKKICRPECRGLCPVCGANLNLKSCSCNPSSPPDSPFAVLLRRS